MSALRVLEEVLSSVPQLFAIVNAEGQIVYRNQRFERELSAVGNIFEFLTLAETTRAIQNSLLNRTNGTWDCRLGRLTLTHTEGGLFTVMLEKPVEYFDAFQQVSSRLDANIIILDQDDVCIWANRPVEFVVGLNLREFTPPDLLDEGLEILEKVRTTREFALGKPSWLMRRDGQRVCFRARWLPLFDASNTHVAQVAIVSNEITEEILAEEALQRSEERYRNVFNNSLDIICVYATDLTLQHITPNVFEHTGLTAKDLVGQNLVEFVHPDDVPLLAQHLKTLKSHPETPVTLEVRIRRKDKSYATMESRIRWVNSFDGEPVIFANARDVSGRREIDVMRQTLLRADKLAAIGQLAAGVAHEINNPAAFIATNLFVLKQYVRDFIHINNDLRDFAMGLDPENREFYLNYLQQNQIGFLLEDMQDMIDTNLEGMERIKHIISELRGYSRDEGEDLEVFDPNGVVETASAIARSHIGVSGQLVVGLGEVPDVLAHRGKLTQVIINLLVNAAQAIQGLSGEHSVKVTTYLNGEHVCIDVADTGKGIPEHLQPRIFEPFFTTKSPEEGTGLGLWLCREIMTQLKGEITVRSSSTGTVFTISLPRMRTADTAEAKPVEFGRMLIIDHPQAGWIPLCTELLRQRECIKVTDVLAALKILESDQAFDLVVCPLPMTQHQGRQLWTEIRRLWPGLMKRLFILVPPESSDEVPDGVRSCPLPATREDLRELLGSVMEC